VLLSISSLSTAVVEAFILQSPLFLLSSSSSHSISRQQHSQLWVSSIADSSNTASMDFSGDTNSNNDEKETRNEKSSTGRSAAATTSYSTRQNSNDLRRHQQIMDYIMTDVVTPDDQRPIILFDGVCNLCNSGVNLAIDHDSAATFRFASLQSEVGKALVRQYRGNTGTTATTTGATEGEEELGNIKSDIGLFVPSLSSSSSTSTTTTTQKPIDCKAYFGSEAVVRILKGLDPPVVKWVGSLGIIGPVFLRDAIYNLVSEHRFMLGETESCRMDFDNEYTSRFVSDPSSVSVSSTSKEQQQ
jgi:predicted DCC family thiol-disulfide oxidoreductase YuxK